ncbi:glycoside hydrolase family 26 protein [Micromonospora sp. WMMD558]|uniref:glycoside hydrolase family 26 protein n=1 Tax=unclassified Micromonospora TaxID=2617518 RepID=UPI001E576980|nr:glycosyl hydrolase [Micromonospora sp. WMMC415]
MLPLLLLAGCAMKPSSISSEGRQSAVAATDPALRASAIRADVSMLRTDKPAFGVTSEQDAAEEADRTAKEIGCRPVWRGVYASIGAPFELSRLTNAAGIPFLTVQPKDLGPAVEQKSWSLAATVAGKNDAKLRAVADTVVEYGDLVVIRYAPEMNGDWSPWAAGVNGNTPSLYVKAWQHVVTLFREAGATNVLWLWAPNIIRGATVEGVSQFWPGDEWVDLIGFTGYGVNSSVFGFESSAGQTFDPTMKLLARLSKKPVVLAETGVEGREKDRWMATLGPWLRAHPNVIGLIWTQAPPPHSSADWRYNNTPRNMKAFKKSVVPHLGCARSR